jgi:hypothetical protein
MGILRYAEVAYEKHGCHHAQARGRQPRRGPGAL